MPRLESLAAGGYFPTPPEVVARIATLIRPTSHGGRVAVRLLDPCAGTGAALHQLAAVIGGETYGVELEADRYEEAAQLLDHALPGSAFSARIEEGAFSCLFLNPPYDLDLEARRLEHTFLTGTIRLLRTGGLLIYIVPQRRLATSARYLASHYQGTRREQPVFDTVARATVEAWALAPLPPLPEAGETRQQRGGPSGPRRNWPERGW